MDASYAGECQRKSITFIHRETTQLYEQALTHGHKIKKRCGRRGNNVTPSHPRVRTPPPPTPQYTIHYVALVRARPEDINVGRRHLVPNEQAADCTGSVEATGRERRRHDANPGVHEMLHTRNQ